MSAPETTLRAFPHGRRMLLPVRIRGAAAINPHSSIAREWNVRVKRWHEGVRP